MTYRYESLIIYIIYSHNIGYIHTQFLIKKRTALGRPLLSNSRPNMSDHRLDLLVESGGVIHHHQVRPEDLLIATEGLLLHGHRLLASLPASIIIRRGICIRVHSSGHHMNNHGIPINNLVNRKTNQVDKIGKHLVRDIRQLISRGAVIDHNHILTVIVDRGSLNISHPLKLELTLKHGQLKLSRTRHHALINNLRRRLRGSDNHNTILSHRRGNCSQCTGLPSTRTARQTNLINHKISFPKVTHYSLPIQGLGWALDFVEKIISFPHSLYNCI